MNPLRLVFAIALAAVTLPAQAIVISYNEDAAGRLTAVNYDGTSRTAFSYDKNGSLLSRISTTTPALTPPPSLAGTYNGLVTNAAPTSSDVGTITLKMLANGTFTGKVVVAGVGYSFAGTFSATGSTPPVVIHRTALLHDLTLSIALDVEGGTQQVTGTLTDGTFTSAVVMDPALYNTTNPVPGGLAGRYTASFAPTETTVTVPQGYGYATITVGSTGAVVLAGKLANNVAITQSSTIVGTSSWPLFVPLQASQGYIAGRAVIELGRDLGAFSSNIIWEKPLTTGTTYTAAFSTLLGLAGSRYDAPVAGQYALYLRSAMPNAAFTASGGNLASPITRSITLDSTNKFITPVDAVALKLALTSSTGFFSGTFKDGTDTRTVFGVLLQGANSGAGYFMGSAVSGPVVIIRQP